MKQSILFVCLGNICRSPLAEGIMLHLMKQNALDVKIDSAGTANYHVGEAPDRRTLKNAKMHGIDLAQLRARQLVENDLEEFDKIFVMDRNNYRDVMRLTNGKKSQSKIHLFLEFTENETHQEMPDPYDGDERDFEQVFQLSLKACTKLCNLLKTQHF